MYKSPGWWSACYAVSERPRLLPSCCSASLKGGLLYLRVQNNSPPNSQFNLRKSGCGRQWAAQYYLLNVHLGICTHNLSKYLTGHNLISELWLATRETGKCRLDSRWLCNQLKRRNSVSTKERKNIYWKISSNFYINSKSPVSEKL